MSEAQKRPSPESSQPLHLPGSCALPLHGHMGLPVVADLVASVDSPPLCETAFLPNVSPPLLKVQSWDDPLQGVALQAVAHPPG